jgi:hypothetical protein
LFTEKAEMQKRCHTEHFAADSTIYGKHKSAGGLTTDGRCSTWCSCAVTKKLSLYNIQEVEETDEGHAEGVVLRQLRSGWADNEGEIVRKVLVAAKLAKPPVPPPAPTPAPASESSESTPEEEPAAE